MIREGWSAGMDGLRHTLSRSGKDIHIVDFDFYSVNVFNRCVNENKVLVTVPDWMDVHPLLKTIPVEWDDTVPYGVLYSPEPFPAVQKFVDALKGILTHHSIQS